MWTYGMQLWGCASKHSINMLQTTLNVESKALRLCLSAPRYVPSWLLRLQTNMRTVQEEVHRYVERLAEHPNDNDNVTTMQLPKKTNTHKPAKAH